MTKKPQQEIERIPYDVRTNSQLSIARHYGGITIEGDRYEYDREVAKQMITNLYDNKLYKPDLVLYK